MLNGGKKREDFFNSWCVVWCMINSAIDSFQYWIGGLHLQRESESGVSMLFHYQYWFSFSFSPACTKCSGSQYEAAVCTTTRDTICVGEWLPLAFVSHCCSVHTNYEGVSLICMMTVKMSYSFQTSFLPGTCLLYILKELAFWNYVLSKT